MRCPCFHLSSRSCCASISTLVFVGLFTALLTAPAEAQEVQWYRFSGCDPGLSSFSGQQQEEPVRFACGALGTYYFGDSGLEVSSSCTSTTHGAEEPALYLSQEDPRFLPSASEWFPCKYGGCFGRRAQPWVAVVDWNQGHGWSVAGLIREVAGTTVDLELFPLDQSSGVTAQSGVSDLAVLQQLCAVAERAWQYPQDLPLAVNMSFGRLLDPAVSESSSLAGETALQDEVGRVLDHLANLGIQLLAAAGNHAQLLFPASHQRVMSAGAVDIEHWGSTGLAQRAWETPSATDTLLPGYGLYLETATTGVYWPVPPGSSYSSALATGWIAGYLADQGMSSSQLGLHSGSQLGFVPNSNSYLLTLDGQTLSGSDLAGASALIKRALEHPAAVCGSLASAPWSVTPNTVTPTLPTSSAAELAADTNLPLPNTRPCVPCHGRTHDNGLEVDFSHSAGLPTTWNLDALYLRVGTAYYQVTDTGWLSDFADGDLDHVFFAGLGTLPAGTSVALVYSLDLQAPDGFWDATPIHMHD